MVLEIRNILVESGLVENWYEGLVVIVCFSLFGLDVVEYLLVVVGVVVLFDDIGMILDVKGVFNGVVLV